MNRPLFLAVPVLMLLDYALTIAGARLHAGGYARHFEIEHYELNPLWQGAVATRRWFNPRHLAIVAAFTAIFVALDAFLPLRYASLTDFFIGALLTMFGAVNARHLANIALFAYVRAHPDELSGSVRMSHLLVLWMSATQTFVVLAPIAIVAWQSRGHFALGAFAGAVAYLLVHLVWYRRARQAFERQRDHGAEHEPVHERVGDRTERP
ncbi:hypothetical protein [Tahibacter soli]|uniref:Uncharacterized protein n=1 Tax=Tahibacter soli TaxID=2983605 RepID=A0A9X4BIN4_9GAMM|nr:hypothetical protein [Tahibacter soli]MDC8013798.1 hypothetical protein [Tahibacter soli]